MADYVADYVADGFVVSVSPITRFPGVPLRVAPYHDVTKRVKNHAF